MPRTMTSAMKAMLASEVVYPVFLFQAEFASGWLYLWTGLGQRSWGGHTYEGIGWLVGFQNIEETTEIRAVGMSVTLRGVDPSIISIALQSVRKNKPGRIYIGGLDASRQIIADPVLAYEGRLDFGTVGKQPAGASVDIKYESKLAALERARERRYTHEDQQIDHPGDRFFEYVGSLQDKQIHWGG